MIPAGTRLEEATHHGLPWMTWPEIATTTKEAEAEAHETWARQTTPKDIRLYTDGSKISNGITGSAWYCVRGPLSVLLFQGCCQIGPQCDIEDREIQAIQEGPQQLVLRGETNASITLCVDNQNPLRALAGGPTAGREYIKHCLEDEKVLQQAGCYIRGKWTPSHVKI